MAQDERHNRRQRGWNDDGFTIVELVVVVGIFTILLSIATMEFNKYSTKSAIESQTKAMYADLMTLRSDALFRKQRRAVKITSTSFSIYPSELATGTPLQTRTLAYPVVLGDLPDPLVFNSRGMIEGLVSGEGICIEPVGNLGAVDSILIETTRMHIGKRNGSDCDSEDIEAK